MVQLKNLLIYFRVKLALHFLLKFVSVKAIDIMENKQLGFGSVCSKEVNDPKTTSPHILPIYATSSFKFENIDQGIDIFKGDASGHVYGRYGNPTVDAVAKKIGQLAVHGADLDATAFLTSSGMSAISTLIAGVLKAGDKILTQSDLYGGTTELFLKCFGSLGIETVFADLQDLEIVEKKLVEDAAIKMIYIETPANPTMAIVDIKVVSDLAKKYEAWTAVDNTFCTPYLQQPLVLGADFSIHSTTKFINGHGNGISGIIIGKDEELMKQHVWQKLKLFGTNSNPWDAWLTHNGMKTLELRMDRHCLNAQGVAAYLQDHSAVSLVNYNGLESHPDHQLAKKQMSQFGGMLSFELKGGFKAGVEFMNKIRFCTLAPTLGDVDTLILHPASSSHINVSKQVREANGITDGLIRLSVGIENLSDIISDLEQSLI